MTRKRFALHPGDVVSKNDGQTHRIGFTQLCECWGVPPHMCMNMLNDVRCKGPCNHVGCNSMIHLYPHPNGNYTLWHRYEEHLCKVEHQLDETRHMAHQLAAAVLAHPIRWLVSRRYRKVRRRLIDEYKCMVWAHSHDALSVRLHMLSRTISKGGA